jgi:hypothetical protein
MPEIRIDSRFSREFRLMLSGETEEMLLNDKFKPLKSVECKSRIESNTRTAG